VLRLRAIHPGEVLQSEFLAPLKLDSLDLATLIGLPQVVVDELIAGKRPLCVDLAIRLAEHFAMGERFWLGLQMDYDIEMALRGRRGDARESLSGVSGYTHTRGVVWG
jgi:addiction module HigA family antidote